MTKEVDARGEKVRKARFLRLNVIPVLVVGGLALAGCSSSSSSSSSSPQSAGTSSSGADISALSNAVNQAAAEPTFAGFGPGYGDKVTNTANLAGKK
ncbi:MAG TPA: hypothetical protein VF070_47130, partial [Streptosporangiaceae bacterium]